ncbi:hypothetical protein BDL97_07G045500 [Sphagnum fallax]|nr:hypothetical protein BDL97_07G045500 [Sphagnum fallax]KAH8956558.1 hypothetical protein BDL97_07G045500 [Sphagnum fallax]
MLIEPGLVLGILGQLQPLLNRVIDAVEITLKYDKSCTKLSALLLKLQPLLRHIANQAPNLSSNESLVHTWLTELEKRLKAAERTLNKSNQQHPGFTAPWSRYRAASEINKLTESVEEHLKQADLVTVDLALSISAKVENATEDTKHALQSVENQLSIVTRQLPNVRRQLTDVTRQCFKPSIGKSWNIEEATFAIITAFQNLNASDDHDNAMEALPLTLATIDPQQPSPKLHVPQFVFGLDDSIGRLQQLLLSRHSDADPHSIGVWGKGGVGKTLLARKVHNSMEVRQHFGNANIIWLTVGKDPNIRSLYRTLSEKLCPNLLQLNTWSQTDYKDILYQKLSSRRVLFIVDDVWEESVIEWLEVAKGPGSVTLWTSRKERVLLRAGVTETTKLHMDKLSEEDSWGLFCVHAFGQYNIPPGVGDLAHLVVEECQGLPLALKVIGGVMVGKKWPGEWDRELQKLEESRMKHQDVEKQLFDCLKTSYDDLENADHANAKECFLYFAAFREDELLEQTRLFQYWVAEGLVPGEVGDDPERETYHVLGLLIGRSLIELESDTENKLCCKIHRVLRDLAFHIIRSHDADEKKQLALYRPGRQLQEFPLEWRTNAKELLAVHRLSLNDNNLKTLPTKISAPDMQTLLISHNEQLEDLPSGFLKGIQQNLKVLDLSFNKSLKAFPKGFSNLKHLIFLHLGNCQGLEILPNSIGELQMLVSLCLKGCDGLQELPKSLGNLQNLKNLNLEYCKGLKKLPNSISKLKKLENLNLGFCSFKKLPKSLGGLQMLVVLSLESCAQLKQLPTICKLESLNVLGCDLLSVDVTTFTSLTNLKTDDHCLGTWTGMSHVKSLVIHKSYRQYQLKSMEELEDLTLHTGGIKEFSSNIISFLNLKTLKLNFLPNLDHLWLNKCPVLLNLTLNDCSNLEVVVLTKCPNLVCLPPLDSLPRLRSLVLKLSIRELPQSFTHRGAFPALDTFNLEQSQLVEFPGVEEGAMPKLQWLNFDDCKLLHTLHASICLLTTIQTITLGSKNEKLITSCKTNFKNSIIRKSFFVDGKPLIPEEEVFESLIPMEGMTTVQGSDKRPFQKVDGDDEERLFKRAGSILGSDLFIPSSPKRFVFHGSSSLAEPTKSEKEHGLCEAL